MVAAAVPTKPVQTTQGSIDADATLVALLVGLTVVTGLVDAFSYLSLGHVFVANMTGTSSSWPLPSPVPRASRSLFRSLRSSHLGSGRP